MESFDRLLSRRLLLHWYKVSNSRGRSLRLLKESFRKWNDWKRQQKLLYSAEKRARNVLRSIRIKNSLDICLIELARLKISNAARIGRQLESRRSHHVPIAKRVDHSLATFVSRYHCRVDTLEVEEEGGELSLTQIYVQDQPITLAQHDMIGILALKRFHFGLSQQCIEELCFGTISKEHSLINHSCFTDLLKQHFNHPETLAAVEDHDAYSKHSVHIFELIALADAIKTALLEIDKSSSKVEMNLIHQHYISTGLEDDPLLSSNRPVTIDKLSHGNLHDTVMDDIDIFLDTEKENQLDQYMQELTAVCNGSELLKREENHSSSLVDVIASNAKKKLSVMKLDVDKSLRDIRSSQMHLVNYNDFIEKKKRQRIQCLRDIKEHCCHCKGPHISKPPFSHGKDYRREPFHEYCQRDKCKFLQRKRRELEWLDNALNKHSNNQERFEREIQQCEAANEKRKEEMKDSLSDSLRLMEMTIQ
jgi:hypothetical protein